MQKSTLDYFFAVLFLILALAIPRSYGQTFTLSDAGINSGNEVCVDVSVADFENIIAMQFSINYDNNLLTFTEATNLSALSLSGANFGDIASVGAVTFSWINPTLEGVFLPDNEIIFSLCFTANAAQNTTTTISFSGNPTAIEVIDNNDQLLNASFNDGNITISSIGSALEVLNTTINPELCGQNDGSISLSVAGGTPPIEYSWQGPDGFSSSDENLNNLDSGTYMLTISDTDNNSIELEIIVPTIQLQLTASSITPVACDQTPGYIDISTNGIAPVFLWNTGQSTEDIQVTTPGIYTVTISEGNCTITESFELLMEDGIASYAYDCTYFNPDLTEAALHVVLWCGGTPPYTFSWSDGSTETTDQNASSLSITNPGEELYSVTITDENGFSLVLDNMAVNCVFDPQISGIVTDVSCTDQTEGSIDITVSGGSQNFSYLWSNNATTEDISGLTSDFYSVTVTDLETGNSVSESFFVGGSLTLAYGYECEFPVSSTTTIVAWTGIPPITYEWSNGFSETVNDPEFANSSSVTVPFSNDPVAFTVTVTDATGCSETIVTEADCEQTSENLTLAISPEQSQVEAGESICVDVVAGNFADIISMQFSIEWDASLLLFDEVTNFNLPDLTHTNFGNPFSNTLTFSWVDYSLLGQTLDDASPLFSVCFTALSSTGSSNIDFTDTPTDIEIINSNDEEVSLSANSGVITVGPPTSTESSIYITNTTAVQGETACVEVRGTDLFDLAAMQFSLNWNPESLNFLGVENFYFENETNIDLCFSSQETAAELGQLRFAYFTSNITEGTTIGEDTPLFELCFEVLTEAGIESIDITDQPIPIEFINTDAQLMNVGTNGGEILILDAIWPGDTDVNGIVNQYDMLNLGIAYGAEGLARIESTDWAPFYLENWTEETPESNIDFKHMDTDGNGQVNSFDTLAISLNWGSTNENWDEDGFAPGDLENGFTQNAPFYVEGDTVATEQMAFFDIVLGDEGYPATDIYGLAFTITFDPEVVVPGSVHAHFENSWIGTPGEDLLTIYREDYEAGELHIGITRTDGTNVSGNGNIGVMQITIKDVIFRGDLTEMQFGIENVRIININEQDIAVSPMTTTTYIDETTGTFNPHLEKSILVFPAPASENIFIKAEDIVIQSLELFDARGEHIKKVEDRTTLQVTDLPSGTYFLRIITDNGIVVKSVTKI